VKKREFSKSRNSLRANYYAGKPRYMGDIDIKKLFIKCQNMALNSMIRPIKKENFQLHICEIADKKTAYNEVRIKHNIA
jgi:hypothetical protein